MAKDTFGQSSGFTRRDFAKISAAAGVGALIGRSGLAETAERRKIRYCIVGLGMRSRMYQQAVLATYAEHSEMVGYCDANQGRLKIAQREAQEKTGRALPLYDAADFAMMVRETRPDVVIVTTVDGYHDKYIVEAMELGCDIVTEKPMTVDAEKCRRILDAQKRTGRRCRVTFNYRYAPPRTQVKELLMSGVIGDVLSVDFHWLLNTIHGADYFRRWHSQKRHSGGLMVHKATHHFDLVNWWLSAVPVTVRATGKREFYTPEMARRLGLDSHHERCHTCPEKDKCGFMLDLAGSPDLKRLYLDNEKHDGYFRDRCVFRPDIDIEDTMNVLVEYDTKATLCYSVNAFNAWEGYAVAFNGTQGRLEHKVEEKVYFSGDGDEQGGIRAGGVSTRIFPLRGSIIEIAPWTGTGGHGGGDKVMLDDIFGLEHAPDRFMRAADQRAGAYSILTGIAANRCFETGAAVRIADLATEIGRPDYPVMPGKSWPLTMPPRV
jgi:predicted dehydrogenase